MGLSSALATAMSGLRTNQASLSIVSSNVANSQTPGYVAQTPNQIEVVSGAYGATVMTTGVSRELDNFVLNQLRTDYSLRGSEGCLERLDELRAARALCTQGARVLGDGTPKIGAHDKPVLFLHPKDFCGTLVELEQA